MIPAGSYFPLASHRLRQSGCGNSPWVGGFRLSAGCVEYRVKKHGGKYTLEYGMSKTPSGWRILQIGTGHTDSSGSYESHSG